MNSSKCPALATISTNTNSRMRVPFPSRIYCFNIPQCSLVNFLNVVSSLFRSLASFRCPGNYAFSIQVSCFPRSKTSVTIAFSCPKCLENARFETWPQLMVSTQGPLPQGQNHSTLIYNTCHADLICTDLPCTNMQGISTATIPSLK